MQNTHSSIEEIKHDDAAAHGNEEMHSKKKSKCLTVDSLTPFEQFIIMKEFCEVTSKQSSCDDDDYDYDDDDLDDDDDETEEEDIRCDESDDD